MSVEYGFKIAQLEKVKGELRALYSLWYDPMGNNEVYLEIKPLIEDFIKEISERCG